MRGREHERGSVTVEWLGSFPLWLLLFLLFWQIVAVGVTVVRAEASAYAGARALARGNDPDRAVRRIAGGMFGSLDQADQSGCEVRVSVTLHAPVAFLSILKGRTIPVRREVVWPAETGGC